MNYRPKLILSLAAVLFLLLGSASASVIEIGGAITDDTTWTDGDTIRVINQVSVGADVTLTVQAGATILVDSPAWFQVYGALVVLGEDDNHVIFSSSAILDGHIASAGSWFGLMAQTGSICNFEYCEIYNGYYGVLSSHGSVRLSKCVVADFASCGIFVTGVEGDSLLSLEIDSCQIYQRADAQLGWGNGIKAADPLDVSITHSTIHSCKHGVVMYGCKKGAPTFQIANCEVFDNDSCGVYILTGG